MKENLNEFTSRMQKAVQKYNNALFITASPDDVERTDDMLDGKRLFENIIISDGIIKKGE